MNSRVSGWMVDFLHFLLLLLLLSPAACAAGLFVCVAPLTSSIISLMFTGSYYGKDDTRIKRIFFHCLILVVHKIHPMIFNNNPKYYSAPINASCYHSRNLSMSFAVFALFALGFHSNPIQFYHCLYAFLLPIWLEAPRKPPTHSQKSISNVVKLRATM